MPGRLNITQLIDTNPVSSLQWRVIGLCFLVAVLDGYDMQAMAFAGRAISQQYGIATDSLGLLLSASLIGLMGGALAGGTVADRLGRRPVIICACLLMGIFSLATLTATSFAEFFLWRFLTGLGIGAAMPAVNSLTAEYAPAQRKAFLMTLMFVGVPVGNILGGFFAGQMMESSGWEIIFLAGGIAPLLLGAVLIFVLPESLHILVRNRAADPKTRALIQKIAPGLSDADLRNLTHTSQDQPTGRAADLFTYGRTRTTLLIWGVFFANLLITFSYISWLPTVLQLAGFPMSKALYLSAGAGVGAMVGGLVIARLADAYGFTRVLLFAAIGATVSIAWVGFSTGALATAVISVLLAGLFVGGLQFGLQALAVQFYPTHIRSTGLGWAFAIGRLGAIIGPIVMGVLLENQWMVPSVFTLLAAVGLISAACIIAIGRVTHGDAPEAR